MRAWAAPNSVFVDQNENCWFDALILDREVVARDPKWGNGILATVLSEGRDVREVLVAAGLARPYDGGRRQAGARGLGTGRHDRRDRR